MVARIDEATMKPLYDAIIVKYETDAKLKSLTARLYQGFEEIKVKSGAPYAVMEVDGVEILDTFTDDVERHQIRIVYYSGSPRPDRALSWLEEVVDSFSDSSLANGSLVTADVQEVRRSGPTVQDATYQAEVAFDVYAQRVLPVPSR